MEKILTITGDCISNYLLIPVLIVAALVFTWRTRGVQFTMFPLMLRLLIRPERGGRGVSSFQAFMVSIASRVGTGNLAGVATAIVLGGPGAIFWMWIIALLGSASAFIESTLAQIFKVNDGNGGYRGGPAYYILRGTGSKVWSFAFAILISITFGLAYNSVQSNTISEAFNTSWHIPTVWTAMAISVATLVIIWGGIRSIARVSEVLVPIMALAYIAVALIIIAMNISQLPSVLRLIFDSAFGIGQAAAGGMGAAMAMGIRRGLFSNEAGEGSAPNVAATANVCHPVSQGLIQALGVFTDTLVICSCTAFIILCSGVDYNTVGGIKLTQNAVASQLGNAGFLGHSFISCAIFLFAFTSIIANYYYGETNVRFMTSHRGVLVGYRLCVTAMVLVGGLASLETVWSMADIAMALMAICNLAAIFALGKYAIRALADFRAQRKRGIKDPQYHRNVNPEISNVTTCWPK